MIITFEKKKLINIFKAINIALFCIIFSKTLLSQKKYSDLPFPMQQKVGTIISDSSLLIPAYIGLSSGCIIKVYDFTSSFFTAMSETFVLKFLVKKTRPDGSNRSSFPSGHCVKIFFSAAMLARYKKNKTSALLFILGFFVAYSRVINHKHDLLDVSCGALLGVVFAFFVVPFLNWAYKFSPIKLKLI